LRFASISYLYKMGTKQTLSEENYLKAIYHLGAHPADKVSPTAIAEALNHNPASVVDMLKKLVEKQWITYDKAKGAKLTEHGHALALHIVRKHRLWEVFLKEKLGYPWDEVHEIAEQLEHIQHASLADRLDKYLGYPEFDPHGDPIPKANGDLPAVSTVTLQTILPGTKCQVTGVKDTSPAFLQYLAQLNVSIGSKIKMIERIPYDDSFVIKIGPELRATVSKKFAENVVVVSKGE
jgi:DtxR family transcriptional regulator, Mn-dependent transcriptional regulator